MCDPEDGLCKCGGAGGIACGEGFTCDVAARTCVSERCRGVDCRSLPGTSCDVIAGRCACGGTAGSVCRADERCEPEEGRCVASGAAGGPCAEGEHRSLETGACRCGAGDACSATQRCRVGLDGVVACVEDACAGVRCAGGLSCDPADGLCACNGARCASGEACLCPGDAGTDSCPAEARACTPAGLCVGVDCGRDTLLTCDPSDGVCKCGGPGGTRCAVEQRCLLLPVPRCEGGDLCALADGGVRACRDGMSCDPEDGVCKCGGRGGSVCRDAARPVPGLVAGRSAEVCVTSGDRAQCREPCDPRLFAASSATCFEGAACFLDTTGVKAIAYCATSGELRPDGAACASPIACAQERGGLHQSLHCAGLGASSATGVCRAYCEVAAGPGGCDQSSGARVCVQVALAPRGLGTCQTP